MNDGISAPKPYLSRLTTVFLSSTLHYSRDRAKRYPEMWREFEKTEGNTQFNLWTMMFPGA